MRQTIFTILLLCTIGLVSCRKDKNQPGIKDYDNQQILNYIAQNNITGMVKDTVGGDTSGIYYKIIQPGSGTAIDYPDQISLVFTLVSFDKRYSSVDTIANHLYDYVGHIAGAATNGLPLTAGLEIALKNDLKYRGASMRVLIPSHLAYGTDGYGSGSITNSNSRVYGNQCLDYYVHVIGDEKAYDDLVIQNYLKNNSLTGYTKTADGLYYKVLTNATGSDPININSTITAYYTGQLLNKTLFDSTSNDPNYATLNIADFATSGNTEGLENFASVGTKISLIMPSALGYGTTAQTGIPVNSCLRFTWTILTVTP